MPLYIEIGDVRALKQYIIYPISIVIMNYVIIPTVRVNETKQRNNRNNNNKFVYILYLKVYNIMNKNYLKTV